MAKQTLLQIVQNILSRMSSDEVNSISDTTESLQVANIVQTKYYDILTRANLPDDCQLFQLTPSGDSTKPVLMYIPATVSKLQWIQYFDTNPADGSSVQSFSHGVNLDISSTPPWVTSSTTSNSISLGSKTFTVTAGLTAAAHQGVIITSGANSMIGTVTSYAGTTMVVNITSVIGSGTYTSWVLSENTGANAPPGYLYVRVVSLQEFLDMTNRFNPTEDNVRSYTFTEGGNNFTFYYKNDHQPQYCTVLSNFYVLFDMYDDTQDNTLQGAKTLCYGQVVPAFSMTDNFIPVLDDNQFPLLLNEATASAFFELKQMPHAKIEQEIKRQWSTVQKNKSISGKPSSFDQLPNFGRQPRTGGYGGYIYGPRLWS